MLVFVKVYFVFRTAFKTITWGSLTSKKHFFSSKHVIKLVVKFLKKNYAKKFKTFSPPVKLGNIDSQSQSPLEEWVGIIQQIPTIWEKVFQSAFRFFSGRKREQDYLLLFFFKYMILDFQTEWNC